MKGTESSYVFSSAPHVQVPQGILAQAPGAIVMIGFGSIGRGLLPLMARHIGFDPARFTVIDPDGSHRAAAQALGVNFICTALTRDNFRAV